MSTPLAVFHSNADLASACSSMALSKIERNRLSAQIHFTLVLFALQDLSYYEDSARKEYSDLSCFLVNIFLRRCQLNQKSIPIHKLLRTAYYSPSLERLEVQLPPQNELMGKSLWITSTKLWSVSLFSWQ